MTEDKKLQKEVELSDKLKPCPFCGARGWLSLDWVKTTYQIECRGCNAFMFRNHTISGFDADIENLVTRWNKRT